MPNGNLAQVLALPSRGFAQAFPLAKGFAGHPLLPEPCAPGSLSSLCTSLAFGSPACKIFAQARRLSVAQMVTRDQEVARKRHGRRCTLSWENFALCAKARVSAAMPAVSSRMAGVAISQDLFRRCFAELAGGRSQDEASACSGDKTESTCAGRG